MKEENPTRNIIAIGGGGFGRNPRPSPIERYILEQSPKDKPSKP